MKRKYFNIGLACALAFSMIATGCGKKTSNSASQSDEADVLSVDELIDKAKTNSDAAKTLADSVKFKTLETLEADCIIELNNENTKITGNGASFNDNVLTITESGTYEITGELSGRIEVNAEKDEKVNIILNGVNVECEDYAPFVVWQADKTLIYLKEGTINTFSDKNEYAVIDVATEDDTPTAAVFSKDDLCFSGEGTLVVNGNVGDAIKGKDDIVIENGVFEISAADDAIVGKDSVAVKYGEFNINAGGDGIKSTNDSDVEKGYVSVEDGQFNITAVNDAIQAETYCYIADGQFDITTTYSSFNQKNTASDNSEETVSDSAKAFKAGNDITVLGGEFTVNSTDDAFHSNETLTIEDGNYEISTGDDGIHSDSILLINGGNITISKSYEGVEAENIIITDGNIDIVASDDGINAAGKSSSGANDDFGGKDFGGGQMPDMSEISGEAMEIPDMPQNGENMTPPDMNQNGGEMQKPDMSQNGEDMTPPDMNKNGGQMQMPDMPEVSGEAMTMPDMSEVSGAGMTVPGMSGNSTAAIYILGGNITVNADGDGIDSNGTISMSGGTLFVDGPTNSGNGFFDYDATFEITGGTLIGAGSSGMMQTISDSSSQAGMAVVFETGYEGGTTITVKDSDGNEIISYTPSKTFSAIAFSTADLEVGETYEVFVNGESYKQIEQSTISTTDGNVMGGFGGGGRGQMNKGDMNTQREQKPQQENNENSKTTQNNQREKNSQRQQNENSNNSNAGGVQSY